jgi:metal-responsive CopG/Arc/MetJ family transcriptional regulator
VDDFYKEPTMATVNFSVPAEVKREFQETFAQENRSAIIADLMRRAVEERRRRQRRGAAIDALLKLRRRMPPASAADILRARTAGRP